MNDTTEFLILADGRILVHNITPTMAAILSELNPHDELMRARACAVDSHRVVATEQPTDPKSTLKRELQQPHG
jgi:hypothetical protein